MIDIVARFELGPLPTEELRMDSLRVLQRDVRGGAHNCVAVNSQKIYMTLEPAADMIGARTRPSASVVDLEVVSSVRGLVEADADSQRLQSLPRMPWWDDDGTPPQQHSKLLAPLTVVLPVGHVTLFCIA